MSYPPQASSRCRRASRIVPRMRRVSHGSGRRKSKMRELDLSYQQALPVLPFQAERIHILVVGLGGTGSFLARHVACLVSLLTTAGKKASLTFIDPEKVESVNLPRENFCRAEIGRYKAETLAMRYAQAFGIEIACIP